MVQNLPNVQLQIFLPRRMIHGINR